jgi:tRNA dimethylallyltransferase
MNQILIICGPTATGKTSLALQIARDRDGEIISADSRQVYIGGDLITGKDIPPGFTRQTSKLQWRGKLLTYYSDGKIKIWLMDIIPPGESFNVSFWRECAGLVIKDILKRGKLPVVVGGTGLYIKSLYASLSLISVPPDPGLRSKLVSLTADQLFSYLDNLNHEKAISLNNSDKNNPRRLIRYIEIASYKDETSPGSGTLIQNWDILQLGLTAPRELLYRRIDERVKARLVSGAAREDPVLAADPDKWRFFEHAYARRQNTWFKRQPGIIWLDVTSPGFQLDISKQLDDWYNQNR